MADVISLPVVPRPVAPLDRSASSSRLSTRLLVAVAREANAILDGTAVDPVTLYDCALRCAAIALIDADRRRGDPT